MEIRSCETWIQMGRDAGCALYHHYNEFGVLTQIDVDNDATGSTDGYIYYLYDAQGRNNRGEYLSGRRWSKGHVLKIITIRMGCCQRWLTIRMAMALPDKTELFEVDANGNMTHYEKNDNAASDNLPDLIIDQQFDERGNMTHYEEDDDGNGQPEIIKDFQYDAHNNLSESQIDTNGDNVPENIFSFEYNAAFDLIRQSFDQNGDGHFDQIATYDYDDHRNATAMYLDRDNNGSIDQKVDLYVSPRGLGISFRHDPTVINTQKPCRMPLAGLLLFNSCPSARQFHAVEGLGQFIFALGGQLLEAVAQPLLQIIYPQLAHLAGVAFKGRHLAVEG